MKERNQDYIFKVTESFMTDPSEHGTQVSACRVLSALAKVQMHLVQEFCSVIVNGF